MAELVSRCPKCRRKIAVKNFNYIRLDGGTAVECVKCSLRFCATLSDKDVEALFEPGSNSPVIKGEEDYILEGVYYPNP